MSGYGWHPHIESGLCLSLGRLRSQGLIRDDSAGSLTWSQDGRAVASVGYAFKLRGDCGTLTLRYSHAKRDSDEREEVECAIRLTSLPLHFGGRRWYMHCPYTGRRALKLYKFSGIAQFCCRTAIQPLPSYLSQRLSGSDRINRQRWKLRQKIGDTYSDLLGEPYKPKWIRWKTFDRVAARDAELAERDEVPMLRMLARLMKYDQS